MSGCGVSTTAGAGYSYRLVFQSKYQLLNNPMLSLEAKSCIRSDLLHDIVFRLNRFKRWRRFRCNRSKRLMPIHFVADPQNVLYNKYGVEKSMLKVMRSLANGLLAKVKEGTKLFNKPMKQDGAMSRIPAEFLVDERGKLKVAHYGKFVGDHLEIGKILEG